VIFLNILSKDIIEYKIGVLVRKMDHFELADLSQNRGLILIWILYKNGAGPFRQIATSPNTKKENITYLYFSMLKNIM
jgi:hypothetical protein